MTPLSDDELAELKAEHHPESYPDTLSTARLRCHAASDDACAWNDDWPCRIARLIAMLEECRHQKTSS